MKTITLAVRSPSRISQLITAMRQFFPELKPSEVISAVKAEDPVVAIRLEATQYLSLLENLCKVCASLDEQGLLYTLTETTLSIQPLNCPRPTPETRLLSLSELESLYAQERLESVRPICDEVFGFIKDIESYEWFTHASMPVDDKSVVILNSMSDVPAREKHWAFVLQEVQNQLTETLCYSYPHRFHGRWNSFVERCDEICSLLIEKKQSQQDVKVKLPPESMRLLKRLLTIACLELQFADCIAPRFAVNWAGWLRRGHLPCDWIGELNQSGKLVLF